jgi:hypothetical protein
MEAVNNGIKLYPERLIFIAGDSPTPLSKASRVDPRGKRTILSYPSSYEDLVPNKCEGASVKFNI